MDSLDIQPTKTEDDWKCRWSSGVAWMVQSFDAVILSVPIYGNAKMSCLNPLVKGIVKTAIAHTAWDTAWGFFSHCLRHVSPQLWRTVVYAQMALIHTYPCIKPHESKAVINYAQLVTTFVGVNYHESWERNACSMLKDRIFRAQTSEWILWVIERSCFRSWWTTGSFQMKRRQEAVNVVWPNMKSRIIHVHDYQQDWVDYIQI